MELKLRIKETITLKPNHEQENKTLQLCGLDRISPALLYTVFFYKSINTESDGDDDDLSFERLKSSLEKVMIHWYPVAGRLKINETTGKLEIDCNDEGVTMVTAFTDTKLEELGKLHEYRPCYEGLVPKQVEATDISLNPLFLVQITRFGCGGYSIGVGGSHALFDGKGAFNFLASWAHISIGENESHLLIPNHSRDTLLNFINPSTSTSSTSSFSSSSSIYEQDHIVGIQDLYAIPMKVMASDDQSWQTALAEVGHGGSQSHDDIQLVTLRMKKEVAEMLKSVAVKKGNLTKCSTFDVLCAHVWKARVKALLLHPNTNICLQFPVDSRRRLTPQLGENFSGNAFVLGSVSCLARQLLEEPIHCTIKRIQYAKDMITNDYIKLYTNALESLDKFFPSMRELTIITDWLKFPFGSLDFGLGKAVGAAILATPVQETAFLMPNLEEGGCDGGFLVRIGVGKQHVNHLLEAFDDVYS